MVLVQSDLGFPATVVPIHTIEMAIEADESILGNPPVFPAVTVAQLLGRERPFHFPFCLGTTYPAGRRLKSHIRIETLKGWKENCFSGLTLQDNCLHVICQHDIRDSAKIFKSVQDAAFQAFEVTTLCEFHVPGPRVSQGHDESWNFMEFAICAQIHLGLSARLGFIPWHSRDGLWRTKSVDIILDDGLPTGVTHLLQGLQDDDAVEYAIVHHLVDLRLKGIQNRAPLMRWLRQSAHLHILLGSVLGNILLFTDGIGALAFFCTIAYYHNKPTSYHLDYLLTSLLTYYGNPSWYEVGHFFPALWVNYSPALTSSAIS